MKRTVDSVPLQGIRVVDFGQYLAGPAVAMILADLGAEVVRVDPPGGPRWDVPCTRVLNRNKRQVALDLTRADDRAKALELVMDADVVVENFRPGVMERLGLGAEELLGQRPELVYLSLPGFSRDDPERRDLQAWEAVVGAAVGQFTDMGLNRVLMGVDPSFSPLPLASSYAAVLGALAVVLALRARVRDGAGDIIEVPLAAALSEGLAYNSMHVAGVPERYLSLREREIDRRRRSGEPLDVDYADLPGYLDAFYRPYVCADGRPFAVVCVSSALHPERALRLLGLWEEAQAAGVPTFDPYLPSSQWPDGADCSLIAHPLSATWNEWLSTRIADAIAQRPSEHWERVFGDARAPAVAHRTTAEWLREQHPREAQLLIEVDDPELGPVMQPGRLVWLERGCDVPVADAGADGAARPSAPGWLEDLTILDLTNVIAGPTIAGTLARFGAQVIKLDPVTPTFDPWNTVLCGLQANRGKRSLLADVSTPAGARLLDRLMARADVVVVNATSAQLQRLGVTQERLSRLHPGAVLCQLDAWGGPSPGPWSERVGYDDLVQAATGITARFGGGLETPEEHAHFGTIDVLGGFCGALATAAALLSVARGGPASTARSSLVSAGQLIQLPFMLDFPDRGPFDEPSGRGTLGDGPGYRCYRTADGWMFLACAAGDLARVLTSFGLPSDGGDARVQERLCEACARIATDELVARLRRLDVGAHRLERLPDLRRRQLGTDDGSDRQAGTVRFGFDDEHPSGHRVELVEPCAIRPRRAEIATLSPAPKYGVHTGTILAELGYRADEIEELRRDRVVADRWSVDYLPD